MEDNKFITRRRELMAKNGEDILFPDLKSRSDEASIASRHIETILGSIDAIIPPHPRQNGNQPYSMQIRQHAEKLREAGETDEEIYQSLLDHVEHHAALARELARRGITSINLFFEPDSEFRR